MKLTVPIWLPLAVCETIWTSRDNQLQVFVVLSVTLDGSWPKNANTARHTSLDQLISIRENIASLLNYLQQTMWMRKVHGCKLLSSSWTKVWNGQIRLTRKWIIRCVARSNVVSSSLPLQTFEKINKVSVIFYIWCKHRRLANIPLQKFQMHRSKFPFQIFEYK